MSGEMEAARERGPMFLKVVWLVCGGRGDVVVAGVCDGLE